MIRIIVAVAGLALVEAPQGGPIDVHLPETAGFNSLVPLLKNPKKPSAFQMDDHNILVLMGKKSGEPAVLEDPGQFRLTLTVPSATSAAQLSRTSFVDFEETLPSDRSGVRSECRVDSADAFDKCEARNAKGSGQELLAAQLRLVGNWSLLGANWPVKALEPFGLSQMVTATVGSHQLRLLVDDVNRSTIREPSDRNYTDTFLFSADVESIDDVTVKDSISFRTIRLIQFESEVCKAVFGVDDCRFLWIENSPVCRRKQTKCVEVSRFFERADTHLAQLYRLTDAYDPNSGLVADEVFVPFGHHSGEHGSAVVLEPSGDGSPRCYGGIIVP